MISAINKAVFDKPFMLSIGPQRCGTAHLEQYFKARDDVCLPKGVKEIFFFDRHFQRGENFYTNHFELENQHQLIAELSTTAFDSFEAPERVHEFFGKNVTLLCPLRHPVYRSYDVYKNYLNYGLVSGGIEKATEQTPQIIHSSRYADHLSRWLRCFGQDKIKIIFLEDMQRDTPKFYKDLCTHLSIPYTQATKPDTGTLSDLDMSEIDWLYDRLNDDIKHCEALLGHTLPTPYYDE